MIWIGWGLFYFGLIRLAVSLVNWLSKLSLPATTTHDGASCRVSVLIPARNEEKNIGNLLTDLILEANYISEIIVYDDQSTDRTAAIVDEFSARCPKIRLIPGVPLEPGWQGKNFACHNLALMAKGDYLLFLDADVRIKSRTVIKALNYATTQETKLLSIFPRQLMGDIGTRLAVPLMNWILLSLLPIVLVRLSSFVSLSAANGQFMFFEGAAYRRQEPHSRFRSSAVEDMAIVQYYKKQRLRVATLLGRDDVDCTMYETLQEAVTGFSKNFFQFFGGSQLLCTIFALLTTVAPFWIFCVNGAFMGTHYLAMILLIRIFVSLASGQSVGWNTLLLIPQQVVLWKIIVSASIRKRQKKLLWKGRNIFSGV